MCGDRAARLRRAAANLSVVWLTIVRYVALAALTGAVAPSPSAPADAATVLVRSLPPSEVMRAYVALYAVSDARNPVAFVDVPSARMPPSDPLVHYAGRRNGKIEIWRADDLSARARDPDTERAANDAMAAALIQPAVQAGKAGPEWQRRFAAAADPAALARAIARAVSDVRVAREAKARADFAWVHDNVTIGMPREQVYRLLRGRGLTAYNGAYNPGRMLNGACYLGSTRAEEAFPEPNQPLPRTPCAQQLVGRRENVSHPPVDIQYVVHSDLACGTTRNQHLEFDARNRLRKLTETGAEQGCL